jgi:16S rRNA (guanine1207-N2)-methyltransferase
MRSARLSLALETGALTLPATGQIAVYRPRIGDDLSDLPNGRVVVLTGFKPDHDHFAQSYLVTPAPPYAAALVCLPRSRDAARALIARRAAEVSPAGVIAVDGQKTDGIDSALKELRGRVPLSESLSKGAWQAGNVRGGPRSFGLAGPAGHAEGFQTLPGIFSADGPDRGSVLLAATLPVKLSGKVADLGLAGAIWRQRY